jgi:hypothetical protein
MSGPGMTPGFQCAAANSDEAELACAGLRLLPCSRRLMGLARGLHKVKPVATDTGGLLGTATEPLAAGAAAPLRDLSTCRPAPSSARMGLMASAILSSDVRLLLPVGFGLSGASTEGSIRTASSCRQKVQHAGMGTSVGHTTLCSEAITPLRENYCITVVVVHVAQTMGGLTLGLLAHVYGYTGGSSNLPVPAGVPAGVLGC